MQDIFHRQQTTVVGTFSADTAILAVAGGTGGTFVNAMVQGARWTYRQPKRIIGQLGSSNVARVVGRCEGQMTIEAIVGLVTLGVDAALFDACNTGSTMTLVASPSGCGGVGGSITYVFGGLGVDEVGGTVQVDDMLIRRNLMLTFTSYNELPG